MISELLPNFYHFQQNHRLDGSSKILLSGQGTNPAENGTLDSDHNKRSTVFC